MFSGAIVVTGVALGVFIGNLRKYHWDLKTTLREQKYNLLIQLATVILVWMLSIMHYQGIF